jgi:uncharacterized protein YlxP (DUF503 family)
MDKTDNKIFEILNIKVRLISKKYNNLKSKREIIHGLTNNQNLRFQIKNFDQQSNILIKIFTWREK